MGMSASQARLLAITSRINDVELKSQQIANIKLRLADESEQVAQDYTKALSKSKLTKTVWDQQSNSLKAQDIKITGGSLSVAGYKLMRVGQNGASDKEANFAGKNISASQLYDMIESGEFYLKKEVENEDGGKSWERISVSGDTQLAIANDDTDLAKAEAEYNAKTLKINNKEKKLDMQMKALDTEHSALTTEQDSVKSLISDNVSKSFNIFS